jgi:hypothetical protein
MVGAGAIWPAVGCIALNRRSHHDRGVRAYPRTQILVGGNGTGTCMRRELNGGLGVEMALKGLEQVVIVGALLRPPMRIKVKGNEP